MSAPARRFVTIMVHKDGALETHTVRLPLWLVRALLGTAAVPKGYRYLDKELDDGTVFATFDEVAEDLERGCADLRSIAHTA